MISSVDGTLRREATQDCRAVDNPVDIRRDSRMATKRTTHEVLAGNQWFRGLPDALVEGILAQGLIRRMTDEIIYAAGDPPNGIFALISGEIRVIQTTAGGRSALLMIASPGVWFGEAAMIDGQPRSSDAIAVGQAVVLQLSPTVFRRLTSDNSQYYAAFASLVCEQYRKAMEYIVTTANLPLPVRLAQRLVGLAQTHGLQDHGTVIIDLHLSQENLAEMVGVSRQSLNRALKVLEAKGMVSVGYSALTIRDGTALETLARSRMLPDALR
jgi:CRP/FNR family transcriptional regulator, cyclic AMP receptor protein